MMFQTNVENIEHEDPGDDPPDYPKDDGYVTLETHTFGKNVWHESSKSM